MSDQKKLTNFSDTDCRYVAYKTAYNDDLCNIVDQHKNKTIAENLTFETAKSIVDELESAAHCLSELKEKLQKRIDRYDEIGTNLDSSNYVSSIRLRSQVDECEQILQLIEEIE